ncbi:MAG: hypothetical protein JSW71_22105 [Gemmatimonadota bacterium]|nr:MAG: hypothetical protein JSW71_22105 [Gemmatimonadota bacterium]
MSNATGFPLWNRARIWSLPSIFRLFTCMGLGAALACARAGAAPAAPAVADTTERCTRWRVEALNQTEGRVYVYHIWATEDRLGWVDEGQIAQFFVDSEARPDVRIKLGHSWYPWAQREDVRITVACSGRPRPLLRQR